VLGSVLLVGITVMFVSGLLSYAAYNPRLAGNDETPGHGILGFFLFTWPTHPYWLYRVTQGVHVTLGLVLVPVVLGKLWSVIPKLFTWPPIRTPAQLLERLSLLLLVGGVVFEFVTGILDIQYLYVFPGSFYTLHYYGAWVFIGAFVVHVSLKFPTMRASLKARRMRDVLRTDLAHTEPEPPSDTGLVSDSPAAPTISRRGALGLVGGSSLVLLAVTVGQSIAGPLRRTAVLAPRSTNPGSGPNGFQINKTAREVGITTSQTDDSWRLQLRGPGGAPAMSLTRAELLFMAQRTVSLPIACVEGWSSGNQDWSGVQLRDLAAAVGVDRPLTAHVESLQRSGDFREVTLATNQILNNDSVLALRVNGVDLSLDHGYPARLIMPATPGVHNTKWVAGIGFET
jgi:DMSO/TMAO reductase YedYZ molybdopterin-dependent catalytic subunit